MTDAEKIAASLSEAQRRWIGGRGAGAKCVHRLIELGIIETYSDRAWKITPLGLSVRAIIQGETACP